MSHHFLSNGIHGGFPDGTLLTVRLRLGPAAVSIRCGGGHRAAVGLSSAPCGALHIARRDGWCGAVLPDRAAPAGSASSRSQHDRRCPHPPRHGACLRGDRDRGPWRLSHASRPPPVRPAPALPAAAAATGHRSIVASGRVSDVVTGRAYSVESRPPNLTSWSAAPPAAEVTQERTTRCRSASSSPPAPRRPTVPC